MPRGLERFHESGQTHYVTFGCYRRRCLFTAAKPKLIFKRASNAPPEGYGKQWNNPTQARTRLEWATGAPPALLPHFAVEGGDFVRRRDARIVVRGAAGQCLLHHLRDGLHIVAFGDAVFAR